MDVRTGGHAKAVRETVEKVIPAPGLSCWQAIPLTRPRYSIQAVPSTRDGAAGHSRNRTDSRSLPIPGYFLGVCRFKNSRRATALLCSVSCEL